MMQSKTPIAQSICADKIIFIIFEKILNSVIARSCEEQSKAIRQIKDCFVPRNDKKTLKMILQQLKNSPETIDFKTVIAHIEENYDFTPTKFTNGKTINEADQNNGSCKIFSFAKLNNLSKEETLSLFGEFYRNDVLKNPEGTDHQNIRNFIQFGWNGISFEDDALKKK